jgi:branched-chain amino acid transport system ATP-binding protein
MVEHVMDAIRSLCDRCVVMNAGRKIAEGTPAEVLAHPEVVRAYLGAEDA